MIHDVHELIAVISAEFESWGCDIWAQSLVDDVDPPTFIFEYEDYAYRAYLDGQVLVIDTEKKHENTKEGVICTWSGDAQKFDLAYPEVFNKVRDWLIARVNP